MKKNQKELKKISMYTFLPTNLIENCVNEIKTTICLSITAQSSKCANQMLKQKKNIKNTDRKDSIVIAKKNHPRLFRIQCDKL